MKYGLIIFAVVALAATLTHAQGAKYKVVMGTSNPQPKPEDINQLLDTVEATKGESGGGISQFAKRQKQNYVPLHMAARGIKGGGVEHFNPEDQI